jgi:hypothetical protein
MTPKEKAKDLLGIHLWETGNETFKKNCALILVNEMIENAGYIWGGRNTETGLTARDEFRKYWHQVKLEIEKL